MILKTLVPKLGDEMRYMGSPIKDEQNNRTGFITDVIDAGDHFELIMDVPGVISLPELKITNIDNARNGEATIMEFNGVDTRNIGVTMDEACKNVVSYIGAILGVPAEALKHSHIKPFNIDEREKYLNKRFEEDKEYMDY